VLEGAIGIRQLLLKDRESSFQKIIEEKTIPLLLEIARRKEDPQVQFKALWASPAS
jgi:hypothetical protein